MFSFFRKLWNKWIYRDLSEKKLPEEELGVEFLRTVVYDAQYDMEITIELACTCGLPVAKLGEDGFYCLHCDRFCEVGILKCAQCAYGMQDRVTDMIDVDEEDED